MLKNKKIVIVVGLIVLIAILFLSLSLKKKSAQPLIKNIPMPKIESSIGGAIKVESRLQEGKIEIPTKLPVYTLGTTPISPEESKQIAVNFGFAGNPQIYIDARFGIVHIWSEAEKGNLRIVLDAQIIDYKGPFTPTKAGSIFPPEEEAIAKSKRFLIGRLLAAENQLLSPTIRYLTTTDENYSEVAKDLADVIDIIFKESINGHQIVNSTTEVGTINVKLNRENDVVSIYIDRTSQIAGFAEYKTKTFSELVSSLPMAKIQSIDSGIVDFSAIPLSLFDKIVVENAKIAYYQELSGKQQYLQPIFVLESSALFKTGQTVSAILYLPALAE